MNITKEQLGKLFEENGYFIEDYALSKAYLSLHYLVSGKSVGQEVYSLCLDGPSGCGKTSFVDAYTKVASKLLKQDVEFINFQLDAETGKDALYEDIDVVATFENNTSKIRIPGTILKAIQAVNNGKYVILKMDEYDKARDSTDTFFNNFLQEGRINTIQHGDIEIAPENMGKLQVFLCKNDLRADLSEPMVRRNRIIRLDYMKPDLLFKILSKFTEKNKCDDGLLNLVTLIYQSIYEDKDMYTKLPSCSECQQSIMDSYLLLQVGGFSRNDIYKNIIENMLKFEDDVKTFEASLEKQKNAKLKKLITEMKKDETADNKVDLNTLIAKNIFSKESTKYTQKVIEIQNLIDEYKEKFSNLEKERKEAIEKEIEKIILENGSLVSIPKIPNIIRSFGDEALRVKRGYDIFQITDNEWTDFAEYCVPNLSHDVLIKELVEHADELDVTIYENGILLNNNKDVKLICVFALNDEGRQCIHLLSSLPVVPSTFIRDISCFINFSKSIIEKQSKTSEMVVDEVTTNVKGHAICNAMFYNDMPLKAIVNGIEVEFEEVYENVYSVTTPVNSFNSDSVSCADMNKVVEASKKIISGKKKVLVNE